MLFQEQFREKYRITLHAARENDQEKVLIGLNDLYQLFAEQYALNNEDSIVVKAKLNHWQNTFALYMDIIRKNGLNDRRIQKFFGLIDDTDFPSFGDILKQKGNTSLPSDADMNVPKKSVDISGIIPDKVKTEPKNQIEESIIPEIPEVIEKQLPSVSIEEKERKEITISSEPTSLEEFIGQQHIVKVLRKEIAIAKAEGRKCLDNILLFGNPGLGKSTLMKLIADTLGVRYEWLDCSQYRRNAEALKALQNFLIKVARENEPVVIAFDEIHMLSKELQSSLLTLLNNRIYVSPPDINGNVKRIPIENFTFIAATTDDDKVLNTIKDRCLRLKFQMVDYTPSELKRIYRNKAEALGLTISDEAIETSIPRSRGSVRYVKSFVDGFKNALYNDNGIRISTNIDQDTAEKYFEERGIDSIGLEKKDLEILHVIGEDPTGAIGAETLSTRVGLETKKYLSEYEPYLVKIGFINITGRGRILTEQAFKHLNQQTANEKRTEGEKVDESKAD